MGQLKLASQYDKMLQADEIAISWTALQLIETLKNVKK